MNFMLKELACSAIFTRQYYLLELGGSGRPGLWRPGKLPRASIH